MVVRGATITLITCFSRNDRYAGVMRRYRAGRYHYQFKRRTPPCLANTYCSTRAHVRYLNVRRSMKPVMTEGVMGTRPGSSIKPFYSRHSHLLYKVTALSKTIKYINTHHPYYTYPYLWFLFYIYIYIYI